MQRIKGVVLDWAGTTVDFGCMTPIYALKALFEENGISLTTEEANADMGLAKKDQLRKILFRQRISAQFQERNGRVPTEENVCAMYPALESHIFRLLAEHSHPIEGIIPQINILRAQGLKIGTTTGYTEEMLKIVRMTAAQHGYEPDFAV